MTHDINFSSRLIILLRKRQVKKKMEIYLHVYVLGL